MNKFYSSPESTIFILLFILFFATLPFTSTQSESSTGGYHSLLCGNSPHTATSMLPTHLKYLAL